MPVEIEPSEIKFVNNSISQERLIALKAFLERATADDIATIRRIYGDNREVLEMIGIEFLDESSPGKVNLMDIDRD